MLKMTSKHNVIIHNTFCNNNDKTIIIIIIVVVVVVFIIIHKLIQKLRVHP